MNAHSTHALTHIQAQRCRIRCLCVCVKCQNAEPIMINGGLIAFSIGLLAIRVVCFVFRDWSLKISLVFHWFLIPQTTIGKHVLFELVRIFCFDYRVRSANKYCHRIHLWLCDAKNFEIILRCHSAWCDDVVRNIWRSTLKQLQWVDDKKADLPHSNITKKKQLGNMSMV